MNDAEVDLRAAIKKYMAKRVKFVCNHFHSFSNVKFINFVIQEAIKSIYQKRKRIFQAEEKRRLDEEETRVQLEFQRKQEDAERRAKEAQRRAENLVKRAGKGKGGNGVKAIESGDRMSD